MICILKAIYTISLADVLEYFRKMCLKMYEPGTAIFLLAPGLGWQASWKKN